MHMWNEIQHTRAVESSTHVQQDLAHTYGGSSTHMQGIEHICAVGSSKVGREIQYTHEGESGTCAVGFSTHTCRGISHTCEVIKHIRAGVSSTHVQRIQDTCARDLAHTQGI